MPFGHVYVSEQQHGHYTEHWGCSGARTALQSEHADWSSHMESLSETISNQMHQLYIKRVLGFSLSCLESCHQKSATGIPSRQARKQVLWEHALQTVCPSSLGCALLLTTTIKLSDCGSRQRPEAQVPVCDAQIFTFLGHPSPCAWDTGLHHHVQNAEVIFSGCLTPSNCAPSPGDWVVTVGHRWLCACLLQWSQCHQL